jgi:ABC-2 type transport system permease protein
MGDLKWISFFSPLTYYTDLVRGTIQGIAYFPMGIDFLALTIFSFGFFFLSLKMHQKTIPKRL